MITLRLFTLAGLSLLTSAASAQIAIKNSGATGAAEINLADAYVQNFDTLPSPPAGSTTAQTAVNFAWSNNTTLPGWFRVVAGSGGTALADRSASGAFIHAPLFVNYGLDGSIDRALGMRGSAAATSDGAIGLVFVNRTNAPITSVTVAYTGEQWRRNSQSTRSVLQFQYRHLGNKFAAGGFNVLKLTGWTPVATLDFNAPSLGPGIGTDGNASGFRQVFAPTEIVLDQPLAPGEFLALRWYYPALESTGQGLAVDDLTIRFSAAKR